MSLVVEASKRKASLQHPRLGFHNSQLCKFSVRDTCPGLIGDLVCGRFGIPDSSFDSIRSNTPAN